MNWTELLQLSGFQSLSRLAKEPMPIAGDVVQLWSDAYALVVPHNERLERDAPGAPFATMAVWAESSGAARRALLYDIEADLADRGKSPPLELLPGGTRGAYGEVIAAATRAGRSVSEYAVYRVASDGAFVHRVADCGRLAYYFRSPEHSATERPYAIALKFRAPV